MRIPPRPLLSFDDRKGLIASIQRRAGEEEINGEQVPLRMGVDGAANQNGCGVGALLISPDESHTPIAIQL